MEGNIKEKAERGCFSPAQFFNYSSTHTLPLSLLAFCPLQTIMLQLFPFWGRLLLDPSFSPRHPSSTSPHTIYSPVSCIIDFWSKKLLGKKPTKIPQSQPLNSLFLSIPYSLFKYPFSFYLDFFLFFSRLIQRMCKYWVRKRVGNEM